ncbi:MAG: hypothetical protein O7J95_19185 [Planctomycetota bacterium]|nr:hypothetical protein [Planctomycetota bacterium]
MWNGIRSLAPLGLPVALLSFSASAQPVRYFPLDVGNEWTYQSDFSTRTIVASVHSRDGDVVVYQGRGPAVRLVDRGTEVDIEVPGDGFVPHYRFAEESWSRRDVDVCDDDREVVVVDRNAAVRTPAGVFEDCLEIAYGAPRCYDAGTHREWWAPDVGLVKWEEDNIGGPVTWTLQSTNLPRDPVGPFIRGDSNADGGVDLSDGVFTLGHLFVGGPEPGCYKAADFNDTGDIDISDAVATFNYLFLGGAPPPLPGPSMCGTDASSDDLTCEAYALCL